MTVTRLRAGSTPRRLLTQWCICVSILSIAALLTLPIAGVAQTDMRLKTEMLAKGLGAPFAIEVLPDGHYLITEKSGNLLRMRPETGELTRLHHFEQTVFRGQGGLLDVALHPDFERTPDIFITVVQRNPLRPSEVGVVLWRARLETDRLSDLRTIWQQPDTAATLGHFGSRIAFMRSRDQWTLLLTLGEQQRETPAQDLKATAGKLLALTLDGLPVLKQSSIVGAPSEVLTMGHRNPQGIDLHPRTGEIWSVEHGPQGGDELNLIKPGSNYGWPTVSYGCPYGSDISSACAIGGGTHAPRFREPVMRWVPVSTAPSSLRFYRGAEFPEMQGDALMTALAGRGLWRIRFNTDGQPVEREWLLGSMRLRLRDSAIDAKGRIVLISDDGQVIRVSRDKP